MYNWYTLDRFFCSLSEEREKRREDIYKEMNCDPHHLILLTISDVIYKLANILKLAAAAVLVRSYT